MHLLYSCMSQEVLLNEWDNLVQEYHKYLSKRIGELGCDPDLITLDDLKDDIKKNWHIGLAMAMETAVISLLEEDEVPNLDTIQVSSVIFEIIYTCLEFTVSFVFKQSLR